MKNMWTTKLFAFCYITKAYATLEFLSFLSDNIV